MTQPQALPFGSVSVAHSSGLAAGRSWQLSLPLPQDRSMLFFGLVTLADGPQENDQVAAELTQRIQDTIRYHHQMLGGHKVSLTNEDFFEQCLQKINNEINVFLRDVQVALPVHRWAMSIGMLTSDAQDRWQVHLSRFGEINAWLLHKAQLDTYKLISIFDSPDPITGSPGAQKYFKNIVSSSLSSQDQLLFCTPNVFNYISLSDVKRILVELSAKAAMKHLENIFREHLQDPLASAMTIKLSTYKQTTASSPLPASQSNEAEQSMNELMATQSQTERILGTSGGLGMNQVKAAAKRLMDSTKPAASSVNAGSTRQPRQKSEPNPLQQAIGIIGRGLGTGFTAVAAAVQKLKERGSNRSPMGKSEYVAVHGSVARVSQWRSMVSHWFRPVWTFLRGKKGGQANWQAILRSPRFYGAVVVLVVVIFVGNRYYTNKKAYEKTVSDAQTNLQSVKTALDRIDSYLIVGREADAVILTQQAKDTLALIDPSLTQFNDQKTAYLAKIDDQQRRLRKEIHIDSPTVVVEDLNTRLNSPAKLLAKNGDLLAIVGTDPHTVADLNLKGNKITSHAIATDMKQADTATRSEANLYVLSNTSIASMSISKGTSSPAATVSSKQPLTAMEFYNSRIYALSPADQQIQRSNGLPNFSVFSAWLKTPSPELATATDLSIDGSIFVLTKTGMLQFTQGARVPSFKIDAVEPAMTDARALSYEPENQHFFILEGSRLLVFKKTGKFVAQYIIKSDQPLLDLYVNEKASIAYVLTSEELFSFPIQLAK